MKTKITRKGLALFVAVLMMFVSYGQIGLYSFADDVQADQNTVTTEEGTPEQQDTQSSADQDSDTSSESTVSEQEEPQGEAAKQLRSPAAKNTEEADVTVSSMEELMAVVNRLNSEGGSATIVIGEDFAINNYVKLNNGTLTILGNDHKITIEKRLITLTNNAQLNLGKNGYSKSLQIASTFDSNPVLDISGSSVLNMYENVTLGPSKCAGSAGCIHMGGTSKFNMYGGAITDCHSTSTVAGGVYMAGNSVFNMSGGTITGCTGLQGGAIGMSGAAPIGGSAVSSVTFNMSGGTISNCTDKYIGGGAVCAFTSYPVTFNMTGGTITGCTSTSYGYGGAISLYTTSDTSFIMDGGNIINNSNTGSQAGYGGGVFVYAKGSNTDIQLNSGTITGNSAKIGGGMLLFAGNVTVADGFSMHNNSASTAGDDVYNAGASLNLGTADTSATLNETGKKITGWYYDDEENGHSRWDSSDLESAEIFTHTGSVYSEEYGAKAAHGPFYTVSFDANGKTLTSEAPEDQTVAAGDTATKPADPTAKGYTFKNWYTEAECTNVFDFSTPITEDKTLYAGWTPIEYTITYDLDGGALEDGKTNPETYTIESDDITLNNPTKEGYTFDGWEGTDLDDATKNVTIEKGSTGDREYTAIWSPIEYTVHFDKNHAKATGSMEDQSFEYDEKKALSSNAFERRGYTFTGWNNKKDGTGTDYANGAEVENLTSEDGGEITLYAQWTANDSKLTYNGNGGDGSMEEQSGKVDQNVKVADNDFTKEGYTFTEWNTKDDGSGDVYKPADEFTLDADPSILYAQWEANSYTVKYNKNKPENASGNVTGSMDDQSFTYDEEKALTENAFKLAGYEFTGWNTKADRSGDDYTDGQTVMNLTSEPDGIVTLYAQWKPKDDTPYTVEYYYQKNGEYPDKADSSDSRTGTTDTEASVTDEDKEPSKDGYALDDSKDSDWSGSIAGDGSLVLKVYFKEQFTVTYTPGAHGTFEEKSYDGLDYGEDTPAAPSSLTGDPGYSFDKWSPAVADTVTEDAEYVAQWKANDDTPYVVESYYQKNGSYDVEPVTLNLKGTTDTVANVDKYKTPIRDGYVLDESKDSDWSGIIAGDGSLVLKVYFKEQFKVTYKPGDHGDFDEESYDGLDYGADTPAAPEAKAKKGYSFDKWSPVIADKVTENAEYVAQWKKNPAPAPRPDPTPARPTPAGGNPAPAGGTPAPAANNPVTAAVNPVPVEDNTVPAADNPEPIEDNVIPMDEGTKDLHWALINLLCTIITVILAILALLRRERNASENEDDTREAKTSKRMIAKAALIAVAIASVIILFLTENFTYPMQLIDKYTILMVILMVIGIALFLLIALRHSGEEEEAGEA